MAPPAKIGAKHTEGLRCGLQIDVGSPTAVHKQDVVRDWGTL